MGGYLVLLYIIAYFYFSRWTKKRGMWFPRYPERIYDPVSGFMFIVCFVGGIMLILKLIKWGRIEKPTEYDMKRMQKYQQAY